MQIENRKKYNWKLICIHYASSSVREMLYNKDVVLTATEVRQTINVSCALILILFTASNFSGSVCVCFYVGLNI